MKNLSIKILSSIALLGIASSCGDNSSSVKRNDEQVIETEVREEQVEIIPLDGSNIDGTYNAKFITLNSHINGTLPGSATFMRKDDRWFAYVRLFAGKPKAWHMQNVYEGERCPTPNDDLNLDGIIDIVEAQAVLGKILIPLDADISSQNSGRNFYPLADLSGSYHYERVTSFTRFFRDLQSEDKNPEDDIRKLAPDEGLKLIGKAVMIQGITEDVDLPETVQTLGRRRNFQTLPIACGIFKKVEALPGEPYSEEIPGPVGDVIEGQDRPAPDDEGEDDTTRDPGRNDDTNDSDDGDGPVSDGEGRTTSGTTTGGTTTGGTTTGGTTTGGTTTGGSTTGGTTTGGTTTGGSTTGDETSSSTTSTTTTTTTGGTDGDNDSDDDGDSSTSSESTSSSESSSSGGSDESFF